MTGSERTRVVRDGLSLGVAVGSYGVAFGATATTAGLSVWQASLLSLLMFTGASQFALVGVLAAGGGPFAAVGSALLLGTRNTIYSMRLADQLSYRGWRRVAAAHWVIDETTALTVRQNGQELSRLAFVTSGAALFLFWNLTTVAGSLGAQSFGPVLQAALDSVVPAAFLALLWPRLVRGAELLREQRIVAAGGAVIALALTPVLVPGMQIIVAATAVLLAIGTPSAESDTTPSVEGPQSSAGGSA
ncbi:MAG: AzlC family ABC transporter permease [Actinomycetota bacterium]|nr:AzlC family ABC transporter permease [Actinomycetota bacterium]